MSVYKDMAHDAGYRGEEAEQVAQAIEQDQMRQAAQRQEQEPDMNDMRAGPYPKDVKKCRGCEADIVFLKTKKGKWIPVNVVPTESEFRGPNAGESKFVYEEHQPHFVTCPCAGEFRR